MSTGKVFLGMFAGAVIGATLGVLFAPEKGSDTRRKISKKGEDFLDDIKDKFNDYVDSIKSKFETYEEASAEMYDQGKSKVKETQAKYSSL